MIPHRNHTPKPSGWEKKKLAGGWGILPVGVKAEREDCHALGWPMTAYHVLD